MEGYFRFTLDNYVVLEDQPEGWESAQVTIKRNEKFGGVFFGYAGEFKFIGDGYEYILNQINILGYCFSVKVLIEYRCDINAPFETRYVGYINIKNAEIDNELKVITANIEPDNVYSTFLSKSGTEYNLYTTQMKFPNGKEINLIQDEKFYHSAQDGSYDVNANTTKKAAYIKVLDCLDYLVKANTQGELSVVSDFFSDDYAQINKWEVILSGAYSGGQIKITYQNHFGMILTGQSGSLTGVGQALMETSSTTIDTDNINNRGFPRHYLTHMKFAWFGVAGNTLQLESWLPYKILSVELIGGTPGVTASFTQTQAYQNGGGNLFITTQAEESFFKNFPNRTDNRQLSFDKLFKELDSIFYLGMKIEPDGNNGFVLRIEPMDYFFSQNKIMRLEGVINVKTSFDAKANYNSVVVGSQGEYVTHNYQALPYPEFKINGVAGNNYVVYTGPNPGMYLWEYIAIPGSGGGSSYEVRQIIEIIPMTGNDYQLVFRDVLGSNILTTTFFYCDFNVTGKDVSLLVSDTSYPVNTCIGETLELKNTFCIDIDYHGDQTGKSFDFRLMNASAPNSDKWVLCYMDPLSSPALSRTLQYKALYYNLASTGYVRWFFNGHLTNHHKIRNNFSRIKEDVYYQPKKDTTFANQLLTYENTSNIIPKRIHKFEYNLSNTQIQTLIANPEIQIEIDINNDGNYIGCWINEIEMNINTKQTTLNVYES